MEVKLKSLSLTNFKGIKGFTTEFSDITTISGGNATGKSTLFDAFTWLFFGKDSHDRKDFEVKTLNPDGSPIHYLDHEVSACVLVDGQEKYFKRVLKEKWVKKRGEETPELQGHETLFWVNNVPYQAGEYKSQVDSVMPESVFKLVSSPSYFNSLPWKDRRGILTQIAGEIPDPEGYDFIKERIKEIGLESFKREISGKKKLLKDEAILIPARIDEISRSFSDPVNAEELKANIDKASKRIVFLESQIEDAAKRFNLRNQENLDKQRTVHELNTKLQNIKLRVEDLNKNSRLGNEQKANEARLTIEKLQGEISGLQQSIVRKQEMADILEKEMNSLREEWDAENEKEIVFTDGDLNCPACNRPLDDVENKKQQLTASFNTKKIKILEEINRNGQDKKARLEEIKSEIKTAKDQIFIKEGLMAQQKEVFNTFSSAEVTVRDYTKEPDYIETQKQISDIKFEDIAQEDVSSQKNEKEALQLKIDSARQLLTLHDVDEKNKERVNQLKIREKELSQLIADLEQQEFQIEGYTRAYITSIEEKINSSFSFVRFKMFNTLLNGGTEETCESLVNGVPYSDVNSAAQIQAGLDIINTLSKFYKAVAPVWIDNREGINEIPSTTSQVINLVVSRDKSLKVTHEVAESV